MKFLYFILIVLFVFGCSPKGPITYSSPLVGKTKTQLIKEKGVAKKIMIFDNSEAYIYTTIEEYFGNKPTTPESKPKKTVAIEHIYYINANDTVYKYQVWEKKIKK
ncbi:MAG: hypothetical protein H6589_07635 [Flavobacteriales bacterium]|nr:hypothetical protein [Flavobacteriales bacterium]